MTEFKESQPNIPENIEGERIYREMLAIAKIIPPPISNPEEQINQFGNNFYLLFEAMKAKKLNINSALVPIYLERAEELYGEKWKKFLEDNNSLMNLIAEVLKEKEIYDKLHSLYIDLIFKAKASEEFIDRVMKDTNFIAVQKDIWKKLNSLLKQASEAMITCGIKPETFYR